MKIIFYKKIGIGPKKPIQLAPPSTGHNACPICGIQLSADELEQHFSTELGRLAKPNMYNERQEIRRTLSMELHAVQSSLQSRTSRWEVSTNSFTNDMIKCHQHMFSVSSPTADISTNSRESSRTPPGQIAKKEIRRGGLREYDLSIMSSLPWTIAANAGGDCTAYRGVCAKGR
jgi:hypothetical protein